MCCQKVILKFAFKTRKGIISTEILKKERKKEKEICKLSITFVNCK